MYMLLHWVIACSKSHTTRVINDRHVCSKVNYLANDEWVAIDCKIKLVDEFDSSSWSETNGHLFVLHGGDLIASKSTHGSRGQFVAKSTKGLNYFAPHPKKPSLQRNGPWYQAVAVHFQHLTSRVNIFLSFQEQPPEGSKLQTFSFALFGTIRAVLSIVFYHLGFDYTELLHEKTVRSYIYWKKAPPSVSS